MFEHLSDTAMSISTMVCIQSLTSALISKGVITKEELESACIAYSATPEGLEFASRLKTLKDMGKIIDKLFVGGIK